MRVCKLQNYTLFLEYHPLTLENFALVLFSFFKILFIIICTKCLKNKKNLTIHFLVRFIKYID